MKKIFLNFLCLIVLFISLTLPLDAKAEEFDSEESVENDHVEETVEDMETIDFLSNVNNDTVFPDVPKSYWAYKEIKFLSEKGVIKGFPTGKFNPLATIIRKDAAAMLVRAMDVNTYMEDETVGPELLDVNETLKGYEEIYYTVEKGMLSVEEGNFKPYEPLTRKEMAKALAVSFHYKGTGDSSFTDVDRDDPYYEYIDAIAKNNITTGYKDGTFRPDEVVTRAQFSAFLARIYSEPIEYTVEQNGHVLQQVQGLENAINLALEHDQATVHPVDNTLQTFAAETALQEETGIKNGVLIYNGAERTKAFTTEHFKPYLVRDLANNTGTMFDTFVVLGRLYAKDGYFAESAKNKANYEEWLWYLNHTFDSDGVLSHLNAAAKEANQKVNVYLTIPYPKRQGEIIDFNGEIHENTLEERIKLVEWYIKSVGLEWAASEYSNLNFKGYYWLNETVSNYDDELLVEYVSETLENQNVPLIYSPHALSYNFSHWNLYGFMGAYLQPNAFRLSGKEAEYKLHEAFVRAQIYNTGINIELNSYAPFQMEEGLTHFEQYVEMAERYNLPGRSLIMYQDTEMVHRLATYTEPGYNEAYQLLKRLIK
ncbi:MAG: DUF4855 domain-containing protein [Bacillus sp. (in: firmicutes)]